MASIGIIANPASGKDIRRLVSYATTIDNNEKVNICKRIVLAAQGLGVESAYFMPETFMIGYAVKDSLESDGVLSLSLGVLDFEIEAAMEDTVRSARMLEELGVGCIVVLGGDGTSRAAAKGITKTPMLSISTGTNNVYPAMMEGTVAGMAAAAVALMDEPYSCCIHDKRITVRVNGEARDTALIDAVVSDDFYAGAKAIWDPERIRRIVVTRCHPATIGFSAVAGAYRIVEDTEDIGFAVELGAQGEGVLAPIAAGVLTPVHVSASRTLALGEEYRFTAESRCMIALDGEREVRVQPGDEVSMTVERDGPWRVLPRKALQRAAELGMYRLR
ncbi:MAG TPA: NAD(+)/NADH kinase [Candidatus Scatomorpha stercorigallinarum]|nr:NAD(+)/NADH kinase [Candidatus Scatomorpha stercorigallinarum]